jgi:hypothetical protein
VEENLEDSQKFNWNNYRNDIESTLELVGYDILPPNDEFELLRARREWGQITCTVQIDPDGRLLFSLTRPLDQTWLVPLQAENYTFEVSRSTSETLSITHLLNEQDCQRCTRLLDELEQLGHANWKQLAGTPNE